MRMSSSCPFTPARQSGLACWDSSPADIVEVRRCCACAIRGRAGWPRRTRIAPRAAGQTLCSENALCASSRAAGGSMHTRASQIGDDSRTIGLCSQNFAGPARPSGSPLLACAWRTLTRKRKQNNLCPQGGRIDLSFVLQTLSSCNPNTGVISSLFPSSLSASPHINTHPKKESQRQDTKTTALLDDLFSSLIRNKVATLKSKAATSMGWKCLRRSTRT